MSKNRKFALLFVWLLLLDLLSKHLFFNLGWGTDWIMIHRMFNLWVSWSLNVPILVTIFIGWISILLFLIAYNQRYIGWFVAACLLAGALWNLIDRNLLGWVRDFIYIGNWFPVFNVADICLNGWILVYFIKEIFAWKRIAKQ